ncbi:MBL fold metallo-hydrolase [Amycolatopsis jejuensis]|uniref:MBL fold metallo-hydrolase n=1 Tax=Amycolatopsis jejuensis TaxID=330084 RepID=UPI000B00B02F|nr:MBL fold metallo-hydrolase [Amycolatopsis jejuensis]
MDSCVHLKTALTGELASNEEFEQLVRATPPRLRPIGDRTALIEGLPGTILVSHGDDGVVLVDCYYDFQAGQILDLIRELTDAPLRFAIPTHFHPDHAGGAATFARHGAAIVGVGNSRVRMSSDYVATHVRALVPAAPAGRPDLTFSDTLTLHVNGEEITVRHPGPAHTDTDVLVHFRHANVLHLGDIVVNFPGMNCYPAIDLTAGGDAIGRVTALEQALELCDDETVVIPGHGAPLTRNEIAEHLAAVKRVHENVRREVAAGTDRESILAAVPGILDGYCLPEPLVVGPTGYLDATHHAYTCARPR